MKGKIGSKLLAEIEPKEKPFEVNDTELKGFTLRVQPSGAITFLVRYRLPNGKQTRVIVGKHPVCKPRQARDEALKVLATVSRGEDPAKKKQIVTVQTFQSFLDDEYSPWAEANRKDGKATVKRIKACFAEFFPLPLQDITALTVEKWRTARLNDAKAPSTVNRDIVALKSLISKAVEWKFLEGPHPLTSIKPLDVDNNQNVRYLSVEEENRLLSALDAREARIKGKRTSSNAWRKERGYPLFPDLTALAYADHLKPMVLVSLNTGLRWGELTSLTRQNVSIERALLTVVGSTSKKNTTRHIPLNGTAMNALKGWLEQSKGELVFPGQDGEQMDNVNKSWEALLAVAKIVEFRWHDMRHHFASWLVMSGVDLNTVRELLGHSDIKMTLRYAHLAPEHKAAAVAKLVR